MQFYHALFMVMQCAILSYFMLFQEWSDSLQINKKLHDIILSFYSMMSVSERDKILIYCEMIESVLICNKSINKNINLCPLLHSR